MLSTSEYVGIAPDDGPALIACTILDACTLHRFLFYENSETAVLFSHHWMSVFDVTTRCTSSALSGAPWPYPGRHRSCKRRTAASLQPVAISVPVHPLARTLSTYQMRMLILKELRRRYSSNTKLLDQEPTELEISRSAGNVRWEVVVFGQFHFR